MFVIGTMKRKLTTKKNRSIYLWILLFLFCFNANSKAQSIQLQFVIADSSTQETLPFATAYLKKTAKGTTTDQYGKGLLQIDKFIQTKDSLVCSYVGYKTKTIPVDLTSQLISTISLQATSTNLNEIVVTADKPIKTRKLLRKIISNIPKNYSTQPVNLGGIYREAIKENDHYMQFNEAIVDLYYTAYPQSFDKRIWKDWYYDDRYAFEFEGSYFDKLMHHFHTKKDQTKLGQVRKSENWSKYGLETAISGGTPQIAALDFVKYKTDFLYPRNFKRYKYIQKGSDFVNGVACYVVQFLPKPSRRKMVWDMGKKLKRSVYVGRMYVDKKSFAVVRMEFQLAKTVDFGFFASRIPLDYLVRVDYQQKDKRWYLHKIKKTEIRATNKKTMEFYNLDQMLLVSSEQELILTDIEKDQVERYSEKDCWHHNRLNALRYIEKPYDANFWLNIPKGKYPPIDQKIIADLSRSKPLAAQYPSAMRDEKQDLSPPIASIQDSLLDYPFGKILDEYHWFSNSAQKQELYDYLKAENAYAENHLIPLKKERKRYFEKLNNFYPKEERPQQPKYKKGTIINHVDSLGQNTLYEYRDSVTRRAIFDISNFKEKKPRSFIYSIKTNERFVGVSYSSDGGINSTLLIFEKGKPTVIDSIPQADNFNFLNEEVVLFTKTNPIKRPDKLIARNIKSKDENLLFLEKDLTYTLALGQTESFLSLTAESKDEAEIYLIRKGQTKPELKLLKERKPGLFYSIKEYNNQIFALTNENAINLKLCKIPDLNKPGKNWETIVPHQEKELLEDFVITKNYIFLKTLNNSFTKMKYKDKSAKKWKQIKFKATIFDVDIASDKGDLIRISYSNPATPFTTYQFNPVTKNLNKLKQDKIKAGIYPSYFVNKRLWAMAADGNKIPITFIKNRSTNKKHKGLILKAYGAYGALIGNDFNSFDAILLDDGFTIAYAHIRGGRSMGNQWYKDGKLLQKENSFTDYIACAEYLIKEGHTSPKFLVGYGNSAGGLVMGAVINKRPELFNTVILDHPYLDVLNTMMNDELPLTTDEYKEWGNPQEKLYFDYQMKYSPYQNIKKQSYPNLIFLASTNDYQTPAWQVAKYVAKIRKNHVGEQEILFLTDFGSGHIGSTSEKEWIKRNAKVNGFIFGNLFGEKENK